MKTIIKMMARTKIPNTGRFDKTQTKQGLRITIVRSFHMAQKWLRDKKPHLIFDFSNTKRTFDRLES